MNFNDAHYHLLLNHLPILGTLIGLLTLVAGFLFKNVWIKRTGLGILVFACISAFPANLTGEGAEEMVEDMPGVTKAIIHEHEEIAEKFILLTSALGLLSLITLFLDIKNKPFAKYGYLLVLAVSGVVFAVSFKLGISGGEIRHTEIRASNANDTNTNQQNSESDKDDD